MSRKYKLDRYKVVFSGIISNRSPLLIGGGGDEYTNSDILKDKDDKPFIPGTSIAGILRHHLCEHYHEFRNNDADNRESDLLKDYFGYADSDKGNVSKIIFDDLTLVDGADIRIRDGIRIDSKIGIAANRGKFDFEIIEPGAKFRFGIEIGGDNKAELLKLIATIRRDIKEERIAIGAKINLGLGRIELKDNGISVYDLEDKRDILRWIKKDDNLLNYDHQELYEYQSNRFRMEFYFLIKDSLIVRHYSNNPSEPDSAHIKSAGKDIIPGTSVKGTIRARAERILNTLNIQNSFELFDFIFGNSSENDKHDKKKYDGSIPSRIKVDEVVIKQNIKSSVQQRIKIDRFTGATINGALFGSMPIFAKDNKIANKLVVELKDPDNAEIGLLLLILKDLWTEDLAIGGEKNIGRGVLIGRKAVISYKELNITICDINSVKAEDKAKLQEYVEALNNSGFQDHIKNLKSIYYTKHNTEAANG